MRLLQSTFSHFPALFFILVQLTAAFAQAPQPVRNAAGATVEGKKFLIAGGRNTSDNVDQFMALDLTVSSWSTSFPPWISFPALPERIRSSAQQATLVQGGTELLVGSSGFTKATFSLVTDSWSAVSSLPGPYTTMEGVMAVTDPRTNQVYVPTGYIPSGSAPYGTIAYDWLSGQYTPVPGMETADPSGGIPKDVRWYSATWSAKRTSVLVYGGVSQNGVANTNLLEFMPSTGTWSIVNTGGDSPGARDHACLVPAYNGETMVLFGGLSRSTLMNSIYTLNLTTLSWTKGADIDPYYERQGHVCTSAGDSFVAWGGAKEDNSIPSAFSLPIVYDLKNGQWTAQFALDKAVNV